MEQSAEAGTSHPGIHMIRSGHPGELACRPFKYAGQVGIFTESDNLYYMRARYYDAEVGRFISEDPAGFIDGPNLYAYVGGNPIMLIDPTGMAWFRPQGHDYLAGRDKDPLVQPGYGTNAALDGGYIDDYVPAGHTFAANHDAFVGFATKVLRAPDWLANIPSMGAVYSFSVLQEADNSVLQLYGSDILGAYGVRPYISHNAEGAE